MSINERFPRICVFAGSADGLSSEYIDGARRLGQVFAENGITLVYGAGKTGMMGAVADGVLQSGGSVIGVVPENLNQPQLIYAGLSSLEVLPDIHKRKARMSELAAAFIALPGGFGTFDELFETLTWAQIGIHHKPVGLLNIRGYFNPLQQMVQYALQEGFIYPQHVHLLLENEDPFELLTAMNAFVLPDGMERWISRENK